MRGCSRICRRWICPHGRRPRPSPRRHRHRSRLLSPRRNRRRARSCKQAAFAAREAFLDAQAVYSGYAVPANVSYAVSELPFAHGSPVAGYTSSGFGYRLHPLENKVKFHYGTDFAANSGTTVCAFADGTVLAAGQSEGYGNYVKLGHAGGYATLYGHCSKLLVRAGETVTLGQPIALVGATGKATGPHLHFELMHDGYYYNPEFYLAA